MLAKLRLIVVLEGVCEDLVIELYCLFLLVGPFGRKGSILCILIRLSSQDLQKQVLVLFVLDCDLEVLRNLAENVKLAQPLLPAVSDFLVLPDFKADQGNVDELFDSAILLERLKEATALLVLTLDEVKHVD